MQTRAARVISFQKYDNTDHEHLLKDLKWINARQLIMFDTAVLVYESRTERQNLCERQNVCDVSNFEMNHCFNTRLATLGGYTLPRCAQNFGQRSITYEGMKLWSTLPNEIQEAQSVEVFKQKVKDCLFEII